MRDKRIDYLGMIGELQKHFADPVKDKIKHEMGLAGADRAEGDLFGGLLTQPESTSIDTARFINLCRKMKIPESRYRAALYVNKKAALQVLSGDQLAGISTIAPGAPTLTVRRLVAAPPDLIAAVKEIAAAVECGARNQDDAGTR